MTLYKEFFEKWKGCDKCPLHETRSKVVLARGTIPCEVLFIGEAPGLSEDSLGLPFVGPAGKLLDRIIQRAIESVTTYPRFRPPTIAFTNIICCIPLGEDEEGGRGLKKVAEPPEDAIDACAERLNEFVSLCSPKTIVCVGKIATKYAPPVIAEGIQYVDIVHPAAILRAQPVQQPLAEKRTIVTLAEAFVRMRNSPR